MLQWLIRFCEFTEFDGSSDENTIVGPPFWITHCIILKKVTLWICCNMFSMRGASPCLDGERGTSISGWGVPPSQEGDGYPMQPLVGGGPPSLEGSTRSTPLSNTGWGAPVWLEISTIICITFGAASMLDYQGKCHIQFYVIKNIHYQNTTFSNITLL